MMVGVSLAARGRFNSNHAFQSSSISSRKPASPSIHSLIFSICLYACSVAGTLKVAQPHCLPCNLIAQPPPVLPSLRTGGPPGVHTEVRRHVLSLRELAPTCHGLAGATLVSAFPTGAKQMGNQR